MQFGNTTVTMNKPFKHHVTVLNYMTPALYKRLNALIGMGFYKSCFSFNDNDNLPEELTQTETAITTTNDSTKYTLINLHIEPIPEIRNLKIDKTNWMIKYSGKPQPERLVWRKKLYSQRKTVSQNQSLVERNENRLDIVLENFCNWFQMVFGDKNSHVTAYYIKQLLSSGFEIHPAAFSIYIEPKRIFSIPHDVAEKYHVSELSTKNQKKKFMNMEDSNVPKTLSFSISNVAFGKCLPASLKHSSPVLDDSSMKANIPDELRTDEYLFKGIEGLRSTKILIEHFDHPDNQEMQPLYFRNFKYEDVSL